MVLLWLAAQTIDVPRCVCCVQVMCRYRNVWNVDLKLRPAFLGGIMQGSGAAVEQSLHFFSFIFNLKQRLSFTWTVPNIHKHYLFYLQRLYSCLLLLFFLRGADKVLPYKHKDNNYPYTLYLEPSCCVCLLPQATSPLVWFQTNFCTWPRTWPAWQNTSMSPCSLHQTPLRPCSKKVNLFIVDGFELAYELLFPVFVLVPDF